MFSLAQCPVPHLHDHSEDLHIEDVSDLRRWQLRDGLEQRNIECLRESTTDHAEIEDQREILSILVRQHDYQSTHLLSLLFHQFLSLFILWNEVSSRTSSILLEMPAEMLSATSFKTNRSTLGLTGDFDVVLSVSVCFDNRSSRLRNLLKEREGLSFFAHSISLFKRPRHERERERKCKLFG